MHLLDNFHLAMSSLKANKMRSFLTMLGIIIGVAAVIAILTVGNSINANVSDMMQGMGANDIFVSVTERSSDEELSEKEIEDLPVDGLKFGSSTSGKKKSDGDYITTDMLRELCRRFPDDVYAVNISHSSGKIEMTSGEKKAEATLYGVSAGYFLTNAISVKSGRFFSEEDMSEAKRTCLLPLSAAQKLFGGDGSGAVGQEIESSGKFGEIAFTVIGVYETKAANGMMAMPGMMPAYVYTPLNTALTLDRAEGKYTYVQVSAKTGVDPDVLKGQIRTFFEPYFRTNRNFKVTVITFEALLSMLNRLLNMITLAISIIAGIALLVGGIGVMNIMLVSVTERTREIGTRKALGAPNSAILTQFVVEAVIICLIGGLIGLALGISGGVAATNVLGYPAKPSIAGIALSIGISMAIGLFFGYFPAKKAAKMNPIEALRYE